MSDSTKSSRARKPDRPSKPYPDFPLTPHASGAWQKKIRGKVHYFGKWGRRVNGKLERIPGDGWEDALRLYKEQADDLHAGRTPRLSKDGLTIGQLCNAFLTSKARKKESGELGSRMFQDYKGVTDLLVETFGTNRLVADLVAEDFGQLRAKMARRWGPVRLGNAIIRTKSIFKFGTENGLIDSLVRFGSEFHKPSTSVLRRHRAQSGERMLEAEQLRTLIEAAPRPLNAMILLGLNGGLGNADVATMPLSAVDLQSGWISFPRPKTGIARRFPLWPETIQALRAALEERTTPTGFAECGLFFLNARGSAWVRVRETSRTDKVGVWFNWLLKRQEMHRKGLSFYTLRHIFRTIADAARDTPAADLIMGHSDPSMASHYRERIDDSRLKAVTDHVRQWLWPTLTPDCTPVPVA